MFGKKKQKQETLVRMRNLAQLDEGFFAHMKDGKDMFDATAREIRNTYQQLGAGITQIQGNIKEASQMAADNGEKEQELTGTHEQMMKIANDGKLGSWIDVNLKWLKEY